MPDFSQRSKRLEMLDADHIEPALLHQNLRELNTINTLLGGHAITVAGLQKLMGKEQGWQVAEIGCGGGDNLAALQRAFPARALRFTGIDLKKDCIDFAKQNALIPNAEWQCCDYAQAQFSRPPQVIFSSLFCHHFSEEQLVSQLRWMWANAAHGFFINDLHRHPLAYHSIALLTKLFSRSPLVRHDAPLSVARGFTRNDWTFLLHQAGIPKAAIEWRWAFRWLIVVRK